MTATYLPVSESLESLESLLSESDELLLLALSRRAGTEEALALADGTFDTACSVQPQLSLSAWHLLTTSVEKVTQTVVSVCPLLP